MKSILSIAKLTAAVVVPSCLSAMAAGAGPSCWIEDASALGQTVWLLCEDGRIQRWNQPRATWEPQQPPSSQRLRAISVLSPQKAFAVGDNGVVLATEDSGVTWQQIQVPVEERLTAIHFRGESGWIAGWAGTMLHSADGGRTWTSQATGVSSALESVYFTDENQGWAVGWVGTIIRTGDSGKTWRETRSEAAKWSLNGVCFLDRSNGWAVGFAGLILRTRDGGVTWEEVSSPVKTWLSSITFDRSRRGWITTNNGLLVSNDEGDSWQSIPLGDSLFLSRTFHFDDSLWAVGPRSVLKVTDAGQASQTVENLHPSALVAVTPESSVSTQD